MNQPDKRVIILMADDDEDDRMMARDAIEEAELEIGLFFVHDGVELMHFLRREGSYADPGVAPRPSLILLDLNMPRKDGREALEEIKGDPDLRSIPVVVLTTSKADEDILRSYNIGASGFITKPVTFEGLVDVMKNLGHYWFGVVELPPRNRERNSGT